MKAVVVGAAGHLGKVVGKHLRYANWEVVELDQFGSGFHFDVTHPPSVSKAFDLIGKHDLLVNLAGLCIKKPFQDMDAAEYGEQVRVNLLGVMNCCHSAIPYLEGGDIINVASRAGAYGHAGLVAYCASKAGVVMFSEALALDLRPLKIRVSCLLPGTCATGLGGVHEPADWQISPVNIGQAVVDIVSMPRRAAYGRVEIKPSFPE